MISFFSEIVVSYFFPSLKVLAAIIPFEIPFKYSDSSLVKSLAIVSKI